MNHRRLLLFCGLFMSFYSSAIAGNITGRVVDEEGSAVAAATVVVLNPGNNSLVRSAITEDNGSFILENIASGKYDLKVTMLGYNTFSKQIEHTGDNQSL